MSLVSKNKCPHEHASFFSQVPQHNKSRVLYGDPFRPAHKRSVPCAPGIKRRGGAGLAGNLTMPHGLCLEWRNPVSLRAPGTESRVPLTLGEAEHVGEAEKHGGGEM